MSGRPKPTAASAPQPSAKPSPKPDNTLPRWIVWTRRLLVVAGSAGIVNAVVGLPSNLTLSREQSAYLRFLVLEVVVCLIVGLPAAIGVGHLLVRFVRAPYRAVLQGALLVSLMVFIVALPPLLGPGHVGLPSALPRDYARGLAVALGLIWTTALAVIVARTVRRRKGKDVP